MSDKTIMRVQRNKKYVVISDTHLNDSRLSWKAKGIMTYLLAKSDEEKLYAEHLKTVSKDGIKSVYSAVDELIKYGYLESSEPPTDD